MTHPIYRVAPFVQLSRTHSGHRMRCAVVVLASAALLVPIVAFAAWQGHIEMRQGVAHVINPAAPAAGISKIAPPVLWRHGGDEDDETGVIFGVITNAAVDGNGNTYLLDMQQSQVYEYDASGNYVTTIGREGEGPGEFRHPAQVLIDADGNVAVLQTMPGKIVLLSPEGDPMGEVPLPETKDGGRLLLFGGARAARGLVLSTNSFSRREGGVSITRQLIRVGPKGNKKATYYSKEMNRNFADMEFDEKTNAQPLFAVAGDGRVYVQSQFDAYAIDVFAPDGKRERVIERAYTHRKRTAKEMEDSRPRIRMRRNHGMLQPKNHVSTTDRDVFALYARPGGSLWVVSSRGARDQKSGTLVTFDEFRDTGHFTRQVAVRGTGHFTEDGIFLEGNRLIVVLGMRSAQRAMLGSVMGGNTESEETGPLEVVCYDLSGTERAAR